MSKFLYYQLDESGECVSVSQLHSHVNDENMVLEGEIKKLDKIKKEKSSEKLGKVHDKKELDKEKAWKEKPVKEIK